jgi:hypothetical protein
MVEIIKYLGIKCIEIKPSLFNICHSPWSLGSSPDTNEFGGGW